MCEFMKDNVLTVRGIGGAMFDRAPGKNQRTHSTAGLAKTTHTSLFPNVLTNLPIFVHRVWEWINKDREQIGEIIRPAMQQQ
jgi:hypothetical protein